MNRDPLLQVDEKFRPTPQWHDNTTVTLMTFTTSLATSMRRRFFAYMKIQFFIFMIPMATVIFEAIRYTDYGLPAILISTHAEISGWICTHNAFPFKNQLTRMPWIAHWPSMFCCVSIFKCFTNLCPTFNGQLSTLVARSCPYYFTFRHRWLALKPIEHVVHHAIAGRQTEGIFHCYRQLRINALCIELVHVCLCAVCIYFRPSFFHRTFHALE